MKKASFQLNVGEYEYVWGDRTEFFRKTVKSWRFDLFIFPAFINNKVFMIS